MLCKLALVLATEVGVLVQSLNQLSFCIQVLFEMGSVWFTVLKKRLRAVPLDRFRRIELPEVLLRDAKVLILELFNPALKSPVLISELDEFRVDLIDGGDLGRDVLKMCFDSSSCVLIVALFHNIFNLLGH